MAWSIPYPRAAFPLILSEINLTPHNANSCNPREVPVSDTPYLLISSYIRSSTDISQETLATNMVLISKAVLY